MVRNDKEREFAPFYELDLIRLKLVIRYKLYVIRIFLIS